MDERSDGLDDLEEKLGNSAAFLAAFSGELARLRDSVTYTNREVAVLSAGFSGGLRRAFDGLVFDGMKLSTVLQGLGQSMAHALYSAAMRPVSQAAGGALAQGLGQLVGTMMPFAKGGSFSQGQVMPFASGGVIAGPIAFPLRGGRGLMGEAGPEAIMPLSRGADGRLGVQAAGAGRPLQVSMHVTTPDLHSFRRSEAQIAAQMGRLLARGQRNR